MKVVSPVTELPRGGTKLAPPMDSLEGKTVGLDDSRLWLSFKPFLDRLGEVIQERYHPKAILRSERSFGERTPAVRSARLDQWAEQVDCAILGLAA